MGDQATDLCAAFGLAFLALGLEEIGHGHGGVLVDAARIWK